MTNCKADDCPLSSWGLLPQFPGSALSLWRESSFAGEVEVPKFANLASGYATYASCSRDAADVHRGWDSGAFPPRTGTLDWLCFMETVTLVIATAYTTAVILNSSSALNGGILVLNVFPPCPDVAVMQGDVSLQRHLHFNKGTRTGTTKVRTHLPSTRHFNTPPSILNCSTTLWAIVDMCQDLLNPD